MLDFARRKAFAADDWGFSPGINAGILELAKRGWLSSVSCVANSAYLRHRLDELLDYSNYELKFSLHLNLTYGKPLVTAPSLCASDGGFFTHRELMKRCLLGSVRSEDVRAEFLAQLNALKTAKIPVTMLDGHHHVHLLPLVYRSVNDALSQAGLTEIRAVSDWDHPFSQMQTLFFKAFVAGKGMNVARCLYLRERHLRSLGAFRRKMRAARGVPLLVHPALYNDFAASGMIDDLKEDRVQELKMILRYLNE